MKIIADLHTHTIASDHAYSTLLENIHYSKLAGHQAIALTDHGPGVPDAPELVHLLNMQAIPEVVEGVRVLTGVEANIMGFTGSLDVPETYLKNLDWTIASFHASACWPGTEEQHTKAYIAAAKNPLVDMIGHSGQLGFQYDYEKVVKYYKEYDKVVEINEASFVVRKGCEKNCTEIARLCKKYEVKVAVNSDCHFAPCIGHYPNSLAMLEEIDFPENLVLNADYDRLMEHIKKRRNIK
ncbi:MULTISPECIES: phosphatase [Clostridiaceae]|uniref:Phosphatase n=1 Tax=Clostridium facile TaxID=2763035 RepID=A0ABR7INT9_9CLOT|nr:MULTISPECIES: phosphatase [Clostridiaceae]MBC5786791.1 phosphatase [Clostridium facile]PWM99764.1 MAG: phosphatase [Massilioclostridium sp.]